MNWTIKAWILGIWAIFGLLSYSCQSSTQARLLVTQSWVSRTGSLLAGASEVDITPPFVGSIAGYGVRQGRAFRGVHDRQVVRALYLDVQGESAASVARGVALVSIDLLLVPHALRAEVKSRLQHLSLAGLILSATHTHSGVGNFSKNVLISAAATGGYREEAFTFLSERIALAVEQAKASAKPARFGFAKGEVTGLSHHRRVAAGETDPDLFLLKIESQADARPLAYLVSFAAHPTVLGPDNLYLSGDFPGFLSREIQRERGGVALFCNAAAGEMGPGPLQGERTFHAARALGFELARRCFDLEKSIRMEADVTLQLKTAQLDLPSTEINGLLPVPASWVFNPLVSLSIPKSSLVQTLDLNGLRFVTLPCDLGMKLGKMLKQDTDRVVIPISYADDYIGYVMDACSYEQDWYESRLHFFGRGFGEWLVGQLGQL